MQMFINSTDTARHPEGFFYGGDDGCADGWLEGADDGGLEGSSDG